MDLQTGKEGTNMKEMFEQMDDAQRAKPQFYLFQNFIDVHGVSLSTSDFSFRLFVARTLPFLFGYLVTHVLTLKSGFKPC